MDEFTFTPVQIPFLLCFLSISGFFVNSENLQWRSKEVRGLHVEKADAT